VVPRRRVRIVRSLAILGLVALALANNAAASSPLRRTDGGQRLPSREVAFLKQAAVADRLEIESARLALRRSSTPSVRVFAKRLIEDHLKSTHALHEIADGAGERRSVRPLLRFAAGWRSRSGDLAFLSPKGLDDTHDGGRLRDLSATDPADTPEAGQELA
jgi:hypothetical protein